MEKHTYLMKKILVLIIAAMAVVTVNAQSIENSSGSSTGSISSDGTIENSSGSTVGKITSDGTIENSSGSTIGKITSSGEN